MVEEARLERLDAGLTPVTDGWFVVNVREGAWVTNEVLGDAFVVEGDDVSFPDIGFTIAVLQPGQAGGGITVRPTRRTSSSSPASACF
jgi:hypothetical protein